jgi:hypothetical protein
MRGTPAALVAILFAGLSACTKNARVAAAIEKLADSPSKFVLYSLSPTSNATEDKLTDAAFIDMTF